MWALFTNRVVQVVIVLAFAAGVGSGWATRDYASRVSQQVQTAWNRHFVEKTDAKTSDDARGIEEEAAQREVAISDSGLDSVVSPRLECLLRFPTQKGISKCVQDLMPKAPVPVAKAKADGK